MAKLTRTEKSVTISIAKVDGVVSIRHNIYNTLKGLAPAWVSPKSPNPTCDNGILMVVKCGKYVRWIHHRYHDEDNGDKQVIILLAVVNKVEGAADTLTGEQFELGPDSLCIAVEMNKDRKLKWIHFEKMLINVDR